jgi:hypothetical protein
MTRTLLTLLPLSLLGGCIIYDNTGGCRKGGDNCGWGAESGVSGDTSGLEQGDTAAGDTAGTDTGEAADPAFALDPDEATAGETIIASLAAENFDLTTVTGVKAYGAVTLLATASRTGELLLTLQVDDAAAEGDTVDLLLEVGSDAQYVPAILTLHAATGGGDTDPGTDTGGCP